MADLAALQVQLELQTAQFTEQMKGVNSQLDKLNNKVNSVSDTFKKAGAAIAGLVSVGTVVTIIRSTVDAMDDLRDSAQKVGVTVEELSALNFAASQSGVGIDTLNTALGILNKNLADVEKGTTDAAKVLRAIGVSATDSTAETLLKMADAFSAIPDGATKTAAAMAALGKSGKELIPFLNEGREGITEMMERAKELGIVIDGTAADMADKFNDAIGEMSAGIRGTVTQIVQGMLPAMSDLAAAFSATTDTSDEWKKFGQGVGEVLKFVAKVAVEVWGAFQDLGTSIAALGAAAAAVFSGNFAGAAEIMRQWDKDSQQLATNIQARVDAINGMGKGIDEAGNAAKKTGEDMKLLGKIQNALVTDTKKTTNAYKDMVQLALTPAQQIIIDLNKAGQQRISALEQLKELGTLSPEALKQLGVTAEQVAEATERLQKAGGAWTVFDQAVSNVAKNEQAIVDMSAAWDTLVEKFAAGSIDPEQFAKLVTELQKLAPAIQGADTAATDLNQTMEKLGDDIADSIASNANNAVNNFIDSIGEAKFSFSDFATSVLKDIAKMVTQLLIMKPLMDSIKSSGFFGSFFANGGAFSSATGLPYGIYTKPTMFGMPGNGPLKAYARGGILGEAGPEAILPLQRGADGKLGVAGSGVEVNVYNNADAEVTTKTSQGADGRTVLDMYIDKRMNERFSNGSMDKVMRTNFGVMRNAGT